MPKKAPEEPKPLSFATPNPWSALPREVYVGKGRGKKEGATTGAQVSLVRRGLFKEESLQPSQKTGTPEGGKWRDYAWWHL